MDVLFQQLETRIKKLAQRCEKLVRDNSDLRQRNLSLTREKDVLYTKNRMAVSQIEGMISHLETMESTHE
jgi:uncharacterized protein (TIGR02449 family)